MARSHRVNVEVVDGAVEACHRPPREIVAAGESDTPMRQSGERVHGPYPHHSRWRLVVDKNGEREKLSFATEADARRRKEELLKEIAGRTVNGAVHGHLAHLRDRGLRGSTVERTETHLRSFFRLDSEGENGDVVAFGSTGGMLEDLRPKNCEALYAALTKEQAVDTHRNALAAAKTFLKWCTKQGWIRSNPAEDVTPIGQRNRGKKQLRIDEARKLVDLCIADANRGEDGAVAVMTSLLMGLRASEVTDRVVRDLDDQGRLLWIEVGKTKKSRRTLEVPALLRPYLLALAKDRGPTEQLISRKPLRNGNKPERHWVLRHVREYCNAAKVPIVCAHSLRGLHATLATEAGVSSHAVASALGHSSPAVTHAHYIQAGTKQRVSTRRVVAKLGETQTRGNLHPVRAMAGTNEASSVPAPKKRLSGLS